MSKFNDLVYFAIVDREFADRNGIKYSEVVFRIMEEMRNLL